uniref:Uncharacterized protein n=1 Tax=Romanomermis culicivorax TaxID=13658 RepID=A0A915KEX3_ROMCU
MLTTGVTDAGGVNCCCCWEFAGCWPLNNKALLAELRAFSTNVEEKVGRQEQQDTFPSCAMLVKLIPLRLRCFCAIDLRCVLGGSDAACIATVTTTLLSLLSLLMLLSSSES